MKYIIASDIHGDAVCCRALLDAAQKEGADKILLLGDILYHGPRNNLPCGYAPKQVIEMLNANSNKIICVRGNCDAEVDQMVLSFPIMSDFERVYDEESGKTLLLSHGHVYSPDKLPPHDEDCIFLSGHTHVLDVSIHDGTPCINPGSVSLPKQENPKTYAVYKGGNIQIKTLDGQVIISQDV